MIQEFEKYTSTNPMGQKCNHSGNEKMFELNDGISELVGHRESYAQKEIDSLNTYQKRKEWLNNQ